MRKIKVYRSYWNNPKEETVVFPERWGVEVFAMKGAQYNKLSPAKIQSSLKNPIGTPTLSQIAKGKRNAVIVFDDISRPTRVKEILPYVIDELLIGGIKKDNICFVCALGAHNAHTIVEFNKKLGQNTIRNFRVYNHNPFFNCKYVGTTSLGTKVEINREVMKHDLKIGIGCILPHPITGFSGGGKLFVPGVASIKTTEQNHKVITKYGCPSAVFWKTKNNIVRRDIDEAVSMIGVDFLINVLVNDRGETIKIYAGDYASYMPSAIKLAMKVYKTRNLKSKKRVVILNPHLKSSEAFASCLLGKISLHEKSGIIVLITDSFTGQVIHYLTGSFGKYSKGKLWFLPKCSSNLKKLIILTKNAEKASEDWFPKPEKGIVWANSWNEVFHEVEKEYPCGKIDVAFFPNASAQYYPNIKVVF